MMRAAAGALAAAVLLGCGGPTARSHPRAATRAPPLDSLRTAGDSLYAHEAYDSARTLWKIALARTEASHDEATAADLLTSLALAAYNLGELGEARRLGEEALARGQRSAGARTLSRTLNALGLIALRQDRNLDAIPLFERAADAARRAGDAQALARTLGNLGLVHTYLGEFDSARVEHRALRQAGHVLHDARYEANGLANEAMLDIWEGDALPALARLDTARALYSRIGYVKGEQNALDQIATAYELTGEYGRAFAALDSALALARAKRLRADEADAIGLIADLHMRVGDYRRAVRSYLAADSLMRRTDTDGDRGAILRGAAGALLRMNELAPALRDAQLALRLNTAGDEPLARIDDDLLLAEIQRRAGDAAGAEARLAAARALAQRAGTRGSRIGVALTEARLADLDRDNVRVLRTLRGAAGELVPGDYESAWEVNALAARAFARTGNVDSAVVAGRRSVAALEHLRTRLSSETLRSTFAVERADVYADLVLALLAQGRTEEAFAVADGARSRALVEYLRGAGSERAAFPGATARGDQLLGRIDALMTRLKERTSTPRRDRGAGRDSATAILEARLERARADYESATIEAAEQYPVAAAVLGAARPRPGSVRRALLPGEVLLEYLLTRDSLLVFAATRDRLRVIASPLNGSALVQRARLLREIWGTPRPDWSIALPAARALYGELIEPLRKTGALQGARRLLVVPHGVLAQVPFAALPDPRTGRFLVSDFAISELPIAAALPVLGRGAAGDSFRDGVAFAPFPADLPATIGEARAVHAAFPYVSVVAGAAATEQALRRALERGGLVHVASHGILSASSPMFSRIELTRGRSGSSDDDGRLELHELLGMTIRSPLVFLSGCETGAGTEWEDDPVRGTADLTLAQAFLAAGAQNVISTLWRIGDAGAAVFAANFYGSLRNADAADALAAAQRALAADRRFGSPYYWAGYVLVGDGRVGRAQRSDLAAGR